LTHSNEHLEDKAFSQLRVGLTDRKIFWRRERQFSTIPIWFLLRFHWTLYPVMG